MNPSDYIWQCVGHNPTRWALGIQVGSQMESIRAWTQRKPDGSWRWEAFGSSPSCDTAMADAETALRSISHEQAT